MKLTKEERCFMAFYLVGTIFAAFGAFYWIAFAFQSSHEAFNESMLGRIDPAYTLVAFFGSILALSMGAALDRAYSKQNKFYPHNSSKDPKFYDGIHRPH